MAIFTDPIVNGWLSSLRGVSPTTYSNVYFCVFTDEPPDDGTFLYEVAGGSYARQLVTLSDPALTPRATTTASQVVFTNMPAVTVYWGGLASLATGGILIAKAPASAPFDFTSNPGDNMTVEAGDFDLDIL